uniref:Ig-like domain-containing protein n=1 Tax=Rhinolophus ferrumequinum TaxID=59479 RepID=A0A671EYB7_RHIFE
MKKTCSSDTFPPRLSVLLVLLQLLSSSATAHGKADFTVSGPGEPIWAMVGADADLPCHLSPNISVEDMEMRWYRDQPSQAVHVHKKGKDMQEEQMVRYRGRTSLARAGLAQGQATVRIYNISALDNGTFHCHFKDGTTFQEATLQLRVAGLGSEPTVSVRVDQDKGVRAECTSADWYPEPQVEWTDFKGQILPSVTNLSASPMTGLWTVASSVTVQQDSVVEDLLCSISNPLLSKRKVAKILRSASFSRRFWSTAEWRIALPLTLAAVALKVATVICIFWKLQREKNGKRLEEERLRAAKAQDSQASRNGDSPLHGAQGAQRPSSGTTQSPYT